MGLSPRPRAKQRGWLSYLQFNTILLNERRKGTLPLAKEGTILSGSQGEMIPYT